LPYQLHAAISCTLRVEKNTFDGEKNFFRREYIDLRMHEEDYRLN
jgi:hypothetical protein